MSDPASGTPADVIATSLEPLAEVEVDVFAEVYHRFYEQNQAAASLMEHMDESAKGKMLEEVTRLMLVPDVDAESSYFDFELKNHKYAYSVELDMYPPLFAAFHESVRSILGDTWQPEYDAAWQAQIDALNASIESHFPSSYSLD